MVAFEGDVVLQGLVGVVMGYVIKHKEILDQAANQSHERSSRDHFSPSMRLHKTRGGSIQASCVYYAFPVPVRRMPKVLMSKFRLGNCTDTFYKGRFVELNGWIYMNEFPIPALPGLLAWLGGDSANFTVREISDVLDIHPKETERSFDVLTRRRILQKKGEAYTVTKWGSYAIDYSLLSIISRWSIESLIYSDYLHNTLQWMYVRYSRLPSRKIPFGIRSSYVLDFSNHFLKELSGTIPSYDIADYGALRNFVIKVSLHPTYTFLMSGDHEVRRLVRMLQNESILRVSVSDTSGSFLTFNSSKLGGFLDRYRKTKKKDTKLTRNTTGQ